MRQYNKRPEVIAHRAEWGRAHRQRPEVKAKHKIASRRHKLERQYGITLDTRSAIHAAQNARCALCAKPEPDEWRLHVDHCHTTGKVRALLCRECNTFIGFLEKRYALLHAALLYLDAHART